MMFYREWIVIVASDNDYILAPRCFVGKFIFAYHPGVTRSLLRDGMEMSWEESGLEVQGHFTLSSSDCPWFTLNTNWKKGGQL